MNNFNILAILLFIWIVTISEAAAVSQITLPNLVKNVNGIISKYLITNLSMMTAIYSHDFYDNNDQPLYSFGDSIDPGGNKKYNLANMILLPDGFSGYVIISSDQLFNAVVLPEETNPPSPNPMTWAVNNPYANESSISLAATEATDTESPPVYYYFNFVGSPTGGSGGVDADWRIYNSFLAGGLQPNHQYGYRVKARDSATPPNETEYSNILYKYTMANAPGPAPFSDISTTSIRANWTPNGNRAGTEYWCENITKGTNSGWVTDTHWDSIDLIKWQFYNFRVKARNNDTIETVWTNLGSRRAIPTEIFLPMILK